MIEKGINGICTLLDEECKVPKGTDEGFLNRLDTAHGRNPFYRTYEFHSSSYFNIRRLSDSKYNESSFFIQELKETLSPTNLLSLSCHKNDLIYCNIRAQQERSRHLLHWTLRRPRPLRRHGLAREEQVPSSFLPFSSFCQFSTLLLFFCNRFLEMNFT